MKCLSLYFCVTAFAGLLWLVTACSNYSFTGASIAPEISTIQIKNFPNRADRVAPELSRVFTRSLEDKFLSGTSLEMVDEGGDIVLEGTIVNYNVRPVDVGEDERATLNRLTIGVNVKFTNHVEEDKNYEQRFTEDEEYDASLSLSSVERELMETICAQLAEEIFNRTVMDW